MGICHYIILHVHTQVKRLLVSSESLHVHKHWLPLWQVQGYTEVSCDVACPHCLFHRFLNTTKRSTTTVQKAELFRSFNTPKNNKTAKSNNMEGLGRRIKSKGTERLNENQISKEKKNPIRH